MLWIAFIIWITLVFDNRNLLRRTAATVVNCFHYLNYLGLWQPLKNKQRISTGCELLSLFELPWSLTTSRFFCRQCMTLWIAFIIWITLVFDNNSAPLEDYIIVVNCFHYLNYLGLWQLKAIYLYLKGGCELLSLFELPWSLTTILKCYLIISLLWIAFIIWITLVFDNYKLTCSIWKLVVNCFHYLNYLGLWQPFVPWAHEGYCCELLSLFELPWSLTTENALTLVYERLWIAFIIWITLVFDN